MLTSSQETPSLKRHLQNYASETDTQVRRSLERENLDRRVLAASTVRVWLARWLQRRRFRRLKLKLEIEIHAIATTRIQSVVRGARERRVFRRMAQAVIVTQRVVRGRRGRLLVKELAQTRYIIYSVAINI